MKATYEKKVKAEKNLSAMFDDLTEIRYDMERVRLLVSLLCKREKVKTHIPS